MENVASYVDETGEVNWLVDDALHMEVPVPVISQAVMQLFASRDANKNWARAIAMMRHGFGGHPYGKGEAEVREIDGVLYCNDGDWVESCSALVENFDGEIELLNFHPHQTAPPPPLKKPELAGALL